MRYALYSFLFLTLFVSIFSCESTKEESFNDAGFWTFTYLKAKEGQKENLKEFLTDNWFAMDRVAVAQGLLSQYQLFENQDSSDWDFIVAVEYFTEDRYESIAKSFEAIRANHQTKKIDGRDFNELGIFLRSENIKVETF